MKHSILLLLIVLFISCYSEKGNDLEVEKVNDSISYYFLESQNLKLKLDERLRAINKAIEISKKVKGQEIIGQLSYQKTWIHYSSGQYDSLIFFDEHLFQDSIEDFDLYYIAKQRYLMGYYFSEIAHNSDKAFQNYTLSKSYYEQIGDSSWVGRNLLNMGTIQKDYNDFFGSKETLTEALKFLKPKSETVYISQCYNLLATNHRKLLNYSDAIKYYNQAITITSSKKDRLIYQNNLAVTYTDNAQYEDAIVILESISQDSILIQTRGEYARVLDNLAYAKWFSGKEHKAEPFIDALKIRTQNSDKRGLIASYTHLGEFYSKNNADKAKSYFHTVIQLSKTLKNPRAEKDALKFLMNLEPKDVKLRDRYVFLQDSLYQQELKVKTQFAKYKYDDKLKQESILRLEKENAEKELEVTKQRTQKIILSSIGAFISVLFGFVGYYFVQRTKRLRKEKEVAALEATYKTEEELSRRLHDDYGGRLNQTMLLVQNNADKLHILDSLEELYDQSRDFSREINDVETGENFWEGLLAMLQFKTPSNTRLFLKGGKETDWSSVPTLTKKVVFKVLQELMINMVRHSQASAIAVTFETVGKTLKISYADDGVGASKKAMHLKNGLRNTEKRIRAIHGTITFDSKEGDGFRAQIEIPK
nr:tetratricopeptide repeat-containing sensor histidine kinase [uncultured Allomuricauda sp.]